MITDNNKPVEVKVRVSVVITNEKANRALRVLARSLNEMSDDFAYRDDVRRALRAARYLYKHLGIQEQGRETFPL